MSVSGVASSGSSPAPAAPRRRAPRRGSRSPLGGPRRPRPGYWWSSWTPPYNGSYRTDLYCTVYFGLLQEPPIASHPPSYIVLGLIELALGEATPYQLKNAGAWGSVGNFWTLQHAQLYTEPERWRRRAACRAARARRAPAPALRDHRRAGGRSTTGGRAHRDIAELRDPGVLKLFFGADPAGLGASQLEAHSAKLAEYEETGGDTGGEPAGRGSRLSGHRGEPSAASCGRIARCLRGGRFPRDGHSR